MVNLASKLNQKLEETAYKLFSRDYEYGQIPPIDQVIIDGKKYARIKDASVEVYNPYTALPFAIIVKECAKYGGDIFLQKGFFKKERSSAKSLMGMLVLEACPKTKLDIFVEIAQEQNAEKMALRLYAGLTTKGERPDFDRLNKNCGV